MEGHPGTGAPHEPEGPSSEAPAALSAEEKVTVLEERLSEKSLEVEELRDGLLRLQADFENYKKRVAREQREGQALALEGLMRELLPVIDNLERAVQAGEKGSDPTALLRGVRMILHQFREMLRKVGLSEIQAVGEVFDPMVHEALMVVNSEERPENTIVEEFEKGYKIRDKLLRPAKVSVAKKAPPVRPVS
ncbi:MAG: nucleotide exchange factor GrpE [Candidatus Tectomicrobia bacterium]|uniref:Protein GrpE n=1 Tax=Tectimicrobiota bacterium TaxID=2528274 RepID=A0A932CQC7_UNCTE|nr:nucleotide exchange factor GrpE [Candidatus Tectomicrobia bacterium]